TGVLRVTGKAKGKLSWKEGVKLPVPVGGEKIDSSFFVNYKEMKGAYDEKVGAWKPATTPYDILIVAAQSLIGSGALHNYISHRTNQGYSVGVVSVEEVEANYSGAELADKIRQCVKDYYLNRGVRYVILVGDPDPD
ncbi:MAG: C25 family cysteine peptidase, partial [Planctomycetota bacterium]|nr:C25 family cysteine peptidase [Planctomycetota bacterium]